MNINQINIKNNSIYEEETIKERARLDERERREKLIKLERKRKDNKMIFKNMLIGLAFIAFVYFTLYKPLYSMFV